VTGATFRLTTTLGPANPARRSRNRIMIDTRFLISADVVAMPTDRWNFGVTAIRTWKQSRMNRTEIATQPVYAHGVAIAHASQDPEDRKGCCASPTLVVLMHRFRRSSLARPARAAIDRHCWQRS